MEKHRYTLNPQIKHHKAVALRTASRFSFRQKARPDTFLWTPFCICGHLFAKGAIYNVKQTSKLKSQYGFTWQEIRTKWDKYFDVWGGELLIKDLKQMKL